MENFQLIDRIFNLDIIKYFVWHLLIKWIILQAKWKRLLTHIIQIQQTTGIGGGVYIIVASQWIRIIYRF